MAGIYIHIPFCRKACHYCNFHFSTSHQLINDVVAAICKEAFLQHDYIHERVDTIYFGGGTPSLLNEIQLTNILTAVRGNYSIADDAEITLESNPDDITDTALKMWRSIGINRLSIGVQSFFESDLLWMNRAHNAQQAYNCIQLAKQNGFENITIDLIYGTPGLSDENWKKNIDTATALHIPHISCYALTVEEGTALHHKIRSGKLKDVDTETQGRHFEILTSALKENGYQHYEISNFAQPGYESKHNSSYWKSKPYLGLGPSAHSYNGSSRQWNISNNALYVQSLNNDSVPAEKEILTQDQKLNETIMIALRTSAGISVDEIKINFSKEIASSLLEKAEKYIRNELMSYIGDRLILTEKGKFLADGIASDLFF